jgi:preprotein translocase subunit SecA
MSLLDRFLRAGEGKKVRALQSLVPDIGALEPDMERLDDDALRAKTGEFRQRLDRGEELDDLLIEAFAVVREAGRRVLGQRHYDVQLMGGAALHFGWVAEMKTGEGKTLVSTLPAYLNGLSGRGMHLVTVNDYLATRDCEWMGRLHTWLGLTTGLIVPGQPDPEFKKAQYAADITYGTNNEFGFDYLRDNMAMSRARQTQRGHNYAIVDEVDSILIDEARTPLIISGRVADAGAALLQVRHDRPEPPPRRGLRRRRAEAHGVAHRERHREGGAGARHRQPLRRCRPEPRAPAPGRAPRQGAVQARQGLHHQQRRGEDRRRVHRPHPRRAALVRGPPPGRRGQGGRAIKEENQTLATVTLQNYFRMYEKLAGMTGTAQSDAAELASTYELQVVPIPTNRPMVRADQADLIYKSEDAKFGAVSRTSRSATDAGQPVLVGTISVEKSEKLSRLLDKRGVAHEVLNAKVGQHFREAEIIAQAGRLHAVTVATNMAGRGVDIILGGNAEGMAKRDVRTEGLDPRLRGRPARIAELTTSRTRSTKVRGRQGARARRPLRARHRAPRLPPHRQPAPGRSGRQGDPARAASTSASTTTSCGCSPPAPSTGSWARPCPTTCARGQDGHQGHRAGADHGRAAQGARSARTSSSTTRS